MKRRIGCLVVGICVLALGPSGDARQSTAPVVHPPAPATNITVSMAEFLTPGTPPAQAFSQAVAAAQQRGAARLIIPPAVYRFTDVTNGFHLIIGGLSDVTIDGQGAEFLFTQPAYGLGIFASQRLVIKNLTVDYDLRIASPGTVQKEPNGTTTIRVDDAYPVTAATPVEAVSLFDHATRTWTKAFPEVYYPTALTLPRPQTLQSPSFAPFAAGAQVLVRHYVYSGQAFHAGDSSDISFEDLTIYNAPGMAFTVAPTGRGFRFARCRIARRNLPDRLISVAADGIHVAGTYGDIIVEDNDFSGQGDDSLNLHSNWLTVTAVAAQSVTLNRGGYALVGVGDVLKFVRAPDLSEVGRATVTAVNSVTGPDYVVTLSAPVPSGVAVGMLAADTSRTNPRFLVRRNVFHDHRARGMLIQGANGVVEDNVVRDVTHQGLHLTTDAKFFFEAMGLENVIIRGNTLERVGYGSPAVWFDGRHMGAISLVADVASGISGFPVHRNVVIENNTIVDTPALGILVASADGVTVRNNTIIGANAIPFSTSRSGTTFDAPASGAIMVTRASNVTVQGNREVSVTGRPDRGVYVDPRNTAGIAVSAHHLEFSPTISAIDDLTTGRGLPVTATLVVEDGDTPPGALVLSATSSNPAVLPLSGIAFGGSGPYRSATLTPAAGQSGSTIVTVTVSDGAWSASDTFTLTVVDDIFLSAVVKDSVVAFAWSTSALPGVQGYALEAGLTPGGTVGTLPLGLTAHLEIAAPSGVFHVRVRAVVGGQPGPPSNEVRVGVGAAAPPGAPSNLLARLDGAVLRLAWHNNDIGGTRTAVVVEALTPSLAVLGSLRLASSTDTLSVPTPPGTFVLRTRAVGPTLSSGASNAVTVTVPGSCVVPDPPQHLTAAANGSAVHIAWDLGVVGSAAPDGWVLEAGLSPSSILGSLPMSARTLDATAPQGTYYLRVRATSACGTSAATPTVILTVP